MKARKKMDPVIVRGYHINARFFEYSVRRNVPSTGATGYMKPVITWKDVKYCPLFSTGEILLIMVFIDGDMIFSPMVIIKVSITRKRKPLKKGRIEKAER